MRVTCSTWEDLGAALEEALTLLAHGEQVQVLADDDLVRLTWSAGGMRAELFTRSRGPHAGWRRSGGRFLWTPPASAPLPPQPRPGSLAQSLAAVGGAGAAGEARAAGEGRALDLLRVKCGQAYAAELAVVAAARRTRGRGARHQPRRPPAEAFDDDPCWAEPGEEDRPWREYD